MNKNILLSFLLSLLCCQLPAQTITKSFMHNGVNRTYTLYIPANYNPNNATPLILNFHGFGGNNLQQMIMADFRPIADTAGFIVVCPLGTLLPILNLPHWNVGSWTNGSPSDDLGFTNALIDTIAANYTISPSNIFATGFSNGGFFSHKLAQQMSNRINAIASVAGTFSPEMMQNPNPTHPTPVLQIHGTADGTVDYNGSTTPSQMLSVDSVLNYWISYNGCNTTPIINALPDLNTNDGSTVEHHIYNHTASNVRVEHFKIIGGNHTWPGALGSNMDINACQEIWKFFRRYISYPTSTNTFQPSQSPITIYPNPSTGIVNIVSSSNKRLSYNILSINGSTLIKGELETNEKHIDLSSLPNNLYFVEIEKELFRVLIQH